jgi:uncharacterized membrane protein
MVYALADPTETARMPTPLITPNLHVILIHYPLAFLVIGTLIETFSFLWPRSGFRAAGRWMILIGALLGLPAVYSGIYAMRDVARAADGHWYDLKGSPLVPGTSPVFNDPTTWKLLRTHLLIQLIATAVCVTVVVVWLGCSDRVRRALHLPLLGFLLLAVAGTGIGAWYGGEMIYRRGVGVEVVSPRPVTDDKPPTRAEAMFPPLELHMVAAGLVSALAAVSVGLSFRKISAAYALVDDRTANAAGHPTADPAARTPATFVTMARTFNPDIEVTIHPFVPAARFWLLTSLLALATAAGGLFVLGRSASIFTDSGWNPKQTFELFKKQLPPPRDWKKPSRQFTHAVTGGAVVVLPILLAGMARFAPRKRLLLAIVALVLVVALAAQVWLGGLMLFDGTEGTVTRLNPPTPAAAS